jgi:hypothetical protein
VQIVSIGKQEGFPGKGHGMTKRELIAGEILERMLHESGAVKFQSGIDSKGYRADHYAIAEAVLDGASWEVLEAMPELNRWPETYSWLNKHLKVYTKADFVREVEAYKQKVAALLKEREALKKRGDAIKGSFKAFDCDGDDVGEFETAGRAFDLSCDLWMIEQALQNFLAGMEMEMEV